MVEVMIELHRYTFNIVTQRVVFKYERGLVKYGSIVT